MPITNLPNPGMDFTPLTPLTAEEMDDLVENIEAINNAASMNYSTSEVDTGMTWIDGKTIYKKTYSKTISSPSVTSAYTTPLGISNIADVVKFEASHKRVGSPYSDISPLPYYKGSNYYDFYVDTAANNLEVYWDLSGAGLTGSSYTDNITIYYTKSS